MHENSEYKANDYVGSMVKFLVDDRNLYSPLLSIGRCHRLITSHGIIASAIQSSKALLKAIASKNGNRKDGQTTSKS